jgi:hypothetical protein
VKAANPHLHLIELETGHDVAGTDPAGFEQAASAFLRGVQKKVGSHA